MTTYLMEPNTGAVDTLESWRAEWEEAKNAGLLEEVGWATNFEDNNLIEVAPNIEGEDGYDENYGEWREVDPRTMS